MMPALAWSLLLVLAASSAFAADVRVTYLVDGKALKAAAPAGTVLTFELHTTNACSAAVASDAVNVEDVTLLEQVKTAAVKSGPKPPKNVLEVRHILTGVTPAPVFYLRVTGTGVSAVGGACQLQYASFADTSAVIPPTSCPPDAVIAGNGCVDKYKASLWGIPPSETVTIQKVKDGTATLADLTAAGATQYGCAAMGLEIFPPTFPLNGDYTEPLYAASIPGVLPSGCLSLPQSIAACKLSDKHILTNREYIAAAAGTPSYQGDDGATSCNTAYLYEPTVVGSRSACVSTAGAYDMVGNLWEWTVDETEIAWLRSGAYGEGTHAGVHIGFTNQHPDGHWNWVGFRCAR